MKKIFTSILLLLPFLTFAQGPWEFTATTESWTISSGSGTANTATQASDNLVLTFNNTTNNPSVSRTGLADFTGGTTKYIEIKMKNLSDCTWIRFGTRVTAGTFVYQNFAVSTQDADYKIYLYPISTPGTINDLQMSLKLNDGTAAGGTFTPTVNHSILIDYIRILNSTTTNTFNFNSSTQGYVNSTRFLSPVQTTESANGVLRLTPSASNSLRAIATLNSAIATVDGANRYAHITVKNTSSFDKLEIGGLVGATLTYYTSIQPLTTFNTGYSTYDVDLNGWNTTSQSPTINFSRNSTWSASTTYATNDVVVDGQTFYQKTATNATPLNSPSTSGNADWAITIGSAASGYPQTATVGNAISNNPVYIDNIVFDNVAPVLSIGDIFSPITGGKKKVTTISLYPNPTQETLNIEAKFPVNKIEIYNLSGQIVLQNQNTNKIDIVNLNNGVYFVKVTQKYGDPEFLKFIKD